MSCSSAFDRRAQQIVRAWSIRQLVGPPTKEKKKQLGVNTIYFLDDSLCLKGGGGWDSMSVVSRRTVVWPTSSSSGSYAQEYVDVDYNNNRKN